MIFGGWGQRTMRTMLGDGRALVCIYAYFQVFFLFQGVVRTRFAVEEMTPAGVAQRPITKEEAAILAGDSQYTPGLWRRWSFLIPPVVLFGLWAFLKIATS